MDIDEVRLKLGSQRASRGVAKLAQEAVENKWATPKTGQMAALEFQAWAEAHSAEEIHSLIGYVKEFAAALGVSWQDLDKAPQDAAERKQREAISCFAVSIWRMRQVKDIEPRLSEAISKVAELEGEPFDVEKMHILTQRLRQTMGTPLALAAEEPDVAMTKTKKKKSRPKTSKPQEETNT